MDEHNVYQNPLITRYASSEMAHIFSPQFTHSTWRKLWIALAEAQRDLGLNITKQQIDEMRRFQNDLNLDDAAEIEQETRHDVMAHILAFGRQCLSAKPIIHLGATSAFVTDNTELIQLKSAMQLVACKVASVIVQLAQFAMRCKDLPTLGLTHLQPAQLTTVGKRATLWTQDLALDLEEVERRIETLGFRGVKGTTGTQASYLALFDGDHAKVEALDRCVTEKMGFEKRFAVTGQTYPRKTDAQVLSTLSGIAQSGHKFANDVRILASRREIEEPFERSQVGSSAMAYKRNPMRAERMTALGRYVIVTALNAAQTAAEQWFERTLDDSANRRIVIPQSFLATDGLLDIYHNVAGGLVVHERVILKNVEQELPFIATENILMAAVRRGGDRQRLHEMIRQASHEASRCMKELAAENDLLERLRGQSAFKDINFEEELRPSRYVGRAPQQVEEFVAKVVNPIVDRYGGRLKTVPSLRV